MKRNRLFEVLIILWIAFLFISCNQNQVSSSINENKSVPSEKKIISEEEYDLILKQARENVKKEIRIETTNNILNPIGSGQIKTTTIEEFLPPDKSHWKITETNESEEKKTEIIFIGDVEYRKENGKDWIKKSHKSKGESQGQGLTVKNDESKKEFLIEESKINNEPYRILISRTLNPQRTIFAENKIWVNKDGLIFKEEFNSSLGRIDNLLESRITTYDYTVNDLKIEAPINSEKQKP